MLSIQRNILEIPNITPDNIPSGLLNADTPMVLKNFAQEWPLVKASQQSNEAVASYLLTHYQGAPVNACYLENDSHGRVFYNEDMTGFNFVNKEKDLKEVLQSIISPINPLEKEHVYVGSTNVKHFFPSMADDISVEALKDKSLLNLWLGTKTKVAAHVDAAQNLACVVSGKRRFIVFPPDQLKNLYVGPMDKAPGGQAISMVDFTKPDFEKFPLFREALAHAQIAELEAGDAIIIPSMWWHYVEGLDDLNILINYWWSDVAPHMARPMCALQHAMLAIRDLPLVQRDAWKAHFDHYVFSHQQSDVEHIPQDAQSILASPLSDLSARKIRANLQNKLRR